jgi:hypothetical protein
MITTPCFFLDRAAFNRWPAVLTEARDYLRALRARNAALRAGLGAVEESFRAPLVRAGARLLVRRRALVAELGALGTGRQGLAEPIRAATRRALAWANRRFVLPEGRSSLASLAGRAAGGTHPRTSGVDAGDVNAHNAKNRRKCASAGAAPGRASAPARIYTGPRRGRKLG